MIHSKSIAKLAIACALAFTAVSSQCVAHGPWSEFGVGSHVAVSLIDGRQVRGQIDSRSNDESLWLCTSLEGATIGTLITTTNIVKIDADKPVELPDRGILQLPAISRLPTRNAEPRKAQSLEVVARIANWDSDLQADGVRLHLIPRDKNGEFVPISGQLDVELQVTSMDGARIRSQTHEQWSASVRSETYTQFGAVIDLPFRSFDAGVAKGDRVLGSLKVRLKLAGEGVLDAAIEEFPMFGKSQMSRLEKTTRIQRPLP